MHRRHRDVGLAQVETRLLQTIDQISKLHASLDHMQGSATAQLQCLEEETAQQDEEPQSLPDLAPGPSMVRTLGPQQQAMHAEMSAGHTAQAHTASTHC